MKLYTLSQFLATSKEAHANFYDYSEVTELRNTSALITVICPEHGKFQQRALWHMRGHKCKACGHKIAANKNRRHPVGHQRYVPNGTIAKTLDDYIKKFSKKHDNKYDYSLLTEHDLAERKRTKSKNKIRIICPVHGVFEQVWDHHRGGNGCQGCKSVSIGAASTVKNAPRKLNLQKFIDRASKTHDNIYDYSQVVWQDKMSKVTIICSKHGAFQQVARYHMDGAGCQKCGTGYTSSKIGNIWLNSLKIDGLITEYKIKGPDTNYIVDGFDPSTNTVYEFLGDYWHGNPAVFDPDQTMTKRNVTFRHLYEETLTRVKGLTMLGYKVVYIWERDWMQQQRDQRSNFVCS
jgi:hypothetical protein